MGWFSRRPSTLVPGEVLDELGEFGRAAWQSKSTLQPLIDPRFEWNNFFSKMLPAYQSDFSGAIAEVHTAAGDDPFAKIGGYRLIAEFEPATEDPLYLDMMDACLRMMSDHGLGLLYATGYERDRWVQIGGPGS